MCSGDLTVSAMICNLEPLPGPLLQLPVPAVAGEVPLHTTPKVLLHPQDVLLRCPTHKGWLGAGDSLGLDYPGQALPHTGVQVTG